MYRKISAFLFIALIFFSIPQHCFVFAQQQPTVAPQQPNPAKESPNEKQANVLPQPAPGKAENTVQMSDIHDLKPLEEIALFDPTKLYYALGAVLILAILAALFLYLKKRKKKIKEKPVIMLPPDELAFHLLDELLDVERIDGKVFYFRLSAILRGYIQGRYGINAPEMTTEELLPAIDRLDVPKELLKNVRELLHSSDPVKFAGRPAVQSKMHNDLMFVRNFVKQTKPEEISKT